MTSGLISPSLHKSNHTKLRHLDVTSMSLIVASFAMIDASSIGDISRESPVDSLPTCNEEINYMTN